MVALPQDMSPFQLGTEGTYRGTSFSIIGRIKMEWEEGIWNNWFLVTQEGKKGWLTEAYGSYSVIFEVEESLLKEKLTHYPEYSLKEEERHTSDTTYHFPIGSPLFIENTPLEITDIKKAICIGSEGEVPFPVLQSRKVLSIDLMGKTDEFGNIEIDNHDRRIYLGHYMEWDEMHCKNFKLLEGWM